MMLHAARMTPAFSAGVLTRPTQIPKGVAFGSQQPGGPRFLAPMVVEGVPKFDPNNPETVRFYTSLMERAQTFARPDVSGRRVGVVAIGQSGRAYLGANIEVKGGMPADTIHGEMFALALARAHGETGVERMVMTLQPCGTCRQVIREAGDVELPIHFVDSQTSRMASARIGELFPNAYSYATPGMNMFKPPRLDLAATHEKGRLNRFDQQAYVSAGQAYLPNPRRTWAGMVAELKDGKQVLANAITISGPNPTITPIQDLLVKLVAEGRAYSDISRVTLVESANPDYSFAENTLVLLSKVAPQARLKTVRLPQKA